MPIGRANSGPVDAICAERGVVVAAFPAAAKAGADALSAGGNAVDAACAAAWALAVCEPAESGLGGQTTMLIALRGQSPVVVDGHSMAPASLRRKLVGRKSQRRGIRATSVPSTVITLANAQKRFGKLSLQDVLAPAISLAENGYAITKLQRRVLKWSQRFFGTSSDEARLFLKPGGGVYEVGDVFRQPLLAATLGRLSQAGADDFYTGKIAGEIVSDMRERGGLIKAKDLSELALPIEREPLSIEYRGHRVLSIPPPGGGVQVLLALQILSRLMDHPCDAASWQVHLAEATLSAFEERERWPDHPMDMTPSLAHWTVSAERAEMLMKASKSGPRHAPPQDSLGESGNTTHLCASDAQGNVVSLTQSIQSVFGAKVAHPALGFVYNNYLSTCPRTPHPYRLGSRCLPQSNAAPTVVLDATGAPRLAIGSAGSRRITSSIVQVLSATLDRGVRLSDAIAAPRSHALLGRSVWVEESMDPAALCGLRERFPKIRALRPLNYKLGAVQAIAWDRASGMQAAADPRRDGAAAWARERPSGERTSSCW